MDPRSKHEFAEWTDLSGEKLKVEIWGKVGLDWHGVEDVDVTLNSKGKGKEKEKERPEDESDNPEWKVLEEWNINLADLVPLPEDVSSLMMNGRYMIYSFTRFFVARLSPFTSAVQRPPGDTSPTWSNLLLTPTRTIKSSSITFSRVQLRPGIGICECEKCRRANTTWVVARICGDEIQHEF
jgi:hypothetical protein